MPLLAKDNPETQKVLSKIVAQTWLDEEFNSQFRSNTKTVLAESGLTLPSGVEFSVHENTLVGIQKNPGSGQEGNVVCEIPLPTKPEGLTDQAVQSWSKGNNLDSPVSEGEEGYCLYCS